MSDRPKKSLEQQVLEEIKTELSRIVKETREKQRNHEDSMPLCMQASKLFHEMWHDIIDKQCVAVVSGEIDLPDSDPDMTVTLVMCAVQREHKKVIHTACHQAAHDSLTSIYGKAIAGSDDFNEKIN